MLQEKWTNHTCIQDFRAVPLHWSHAPNQEQTLKREQMDKYNQLKLIHIFVRCVHKMTPLQLVK